MLCICVLHPCCAFYAICLFMYWRWSSKIAVIYSRLFKENQSFVKQQHILFLRERQTLKLCFLNYGLERLTSNCVRLSCACAMPPYCTLGDLKQRVIIEPFSNLAKNVRNVDFIRHIKACERHSNCARCSPPFRYYTLGPVISKVREGGRKLWRGQKNLAFLLFEIASLLNAMLLSWSVSLRLCKD